MTKENMRYLFQLMSNNLIASGEQNETKIKLSYAVTWTSYFRLDDYAQDFISNSRSNLFQMTCECFIIKGEEKNNSYTTRKKEFICH
jgi:hypothetical protein